MLPTELLMFGVQGRGWCSPRCLKATPTHVQRSISQLIGVCSKATWDRRRFELESDLKALEAGRQDYRVPAADWRTCWLNGITASSRRAEACEPPDAAPTGLRAGRAAPTRTPTAPRWRCWNRPPAQSGAADPESLPDALYADLPDQQMLVSFEAPDARALLERFNLAQAQGQLYRAYSVIITARRNEPARYKQLMKYVKLLRPDGDGGGRRRLSASHSRSTGRPACSAAPPAMAWHSSKFLPALLHVDEAGI